MRTDVDAGQLRSLAEGHEFIEITADEALDLADALESYYALQEYGEETEAIDNGATEGVSGS